MNQYRVVLRKEMSSRSFYISADSFEESGEMVYFYKLNDEDKVEKVVGAVMKDTMCTIEILSEKKTD